MEKAGDVVSLATENKYYSRARMMACYLRFGIHARYPNILPNFSWFVISISLFGCWLIWIYGSWQYVTAVFWTKVITNTFLGLFIHIFSPEQFYFFNNLGYNKSRLYTFTFLFDMVIWLLLSWLTIKILP